jgi:hypothetical protein
MQVKVAASVDVVVLSNPVPEVPELAAVAAVMEPLLVATQLNVVLGLDVRLSLEPVQGRFLVAIIYIYENFHRMAQRASSRNV